MSKTAPPFPANRARALRRVYDTIAALDLAGRSESGLSGKEADEQRDNLAQAVRLLLSEAHLEKRSVPAGCTLDLLANPATGETI
jgi:hypothetical protein